MRNAHTADAQQLAESLKSIVRYTHALSQENERGDAAARARSTTRLLAQHL